MMSRMFVAFACTAMAIGCSENDTERLSKVCRKTVQHLETAAGGPARPSCQRLSGTARLLWRADAGQQGRHALELGQNAGGIENRGEPDQPRSDSTQWNREGNLPKNNGAMDVAQSTTGVNKVINEILFVSE